MKYQRVQFIQMIVYTPRPKWTTLSSAESPAYAIEDDGPGHVRIQSPGGNVVRVPWGNIAAAELLADVRAAGDAVMRRHDAILSALAKTEPPLEIEKPSVAPLAEDSPPVDLIGQEVAKARNALTKKRR